MAQPNDNIGETNNNIGISSRTRARLSKTLDALSAHINTRAATIFLATIVGTTPVQAQTTSTPSPARVEASAWVPNPEYDRIIGQMKEGETAEKVAMRLGYKDPNFIFGLTDYVDERNKRLIAKKDQEGRKLDQVIIAEEGANEGRRQVAIKDQLIIDTGNLKIILTLVRKQKSGPLTEREEGFVREMYNRQTTSPEHKKILEETFPDIIAPLLLASKK